MATDNPLLAGMLGGIELARATMGNQLAQQQATMQNVLQMQQMQLEAAQSRQLFEMRQVDMAAQTKLREMEINARVQESAARVKQAEIEAPIRTKELQARLLQANANSAVADAQLAELAIKSGAAQIKGGFTTALTGVAPEAQPAFAQQFFSAQRQMFDALPPERRNPQALQALGLVETEWRMETQKRKDAAVGMVESLGSELEKLDGMDSAGTPYKMKLANLQARYNSVIRPSLLMAGVDTTQHDSVFNGTSFGSATPGGLGALTAPTFQRTLPPASEVTVPEVQAPAVETRMGAVDERLDRLAQSSADPALKTEALNARRRLEAVRRATAEGFPTTQRGGGLSFRPTGFGGMTGRTLTLRDLDALEQMQDPRQINQFLNQFVAPIPSTDMGGDIGLIPMM